MSGKFAQTTDVPVEKSRMEIERTLQRYGATSFAYGTQDDTATIAFRIEERYIRFTLKMPARTERRFTHFKHGSGQYLPRTSSAAEAQWEQGCRSSWRALALVIKAKLEAVAAGITTVEDEFLAHTMLPDGTTFGEWARPQIDQSYRVGGMPKLLMIGGPADAH